MLSIAPAGHDNVNQPFPLGALRRFTLEERLEQNGKEICVPLGTRQHEF